MVDFVRGNLFVVDAIFGDVEQTLPVRHADTGGRATTARLAWSAERGTARILRRQHSLVFVGIQTNQTVKGEVPPLLENRGAAAQPPRRDPRARPPDDDAARGVEGMHLVGGAGTPLPPLLPNTK